TLRVTDNDNGCYMEDTVTVGQNSDKPTADAGADVELTCTTTSVMLTGVGDSTNPDADLVYSWSGPSGYSASTAQITVSVAGDYTLRVTDNDNGCYMEDTVTVGEDKTVPTADAGADMELTCATTTVTLTGNGSSIKPGAILVYSWTGPDGFTADMAEIMVSKIGLYKLRVTDSQNGCYDEDSVEVTEDVTPPTVTMTPLEPVCIENGPVQIMASPSGGTFSGSAAINADTGLFDPMIAGNGLHTVTYTYIGLNGCEGKATIELSVITCQAEPECDTVFAYNSETSTCFSEVSELKNNNRWGWTNEITAPGTYNFTLYGGAAHCNTENGYEYGNARVVYADNGDVTVYYEMTGGSVLNEAHVYIGCTPVPMVTKGKKTEATVAPGQYNFNPDLGGGVQNYQVGPVNVSGGSFYIIVHGVACTSGVLDGNNNGIAFDNEVSVRCATPSAAFTKPESLEKSGDIVVAPNPFVDKVGISYRYDYDTDVSIEIRDIRGRLIDSYENKSYVTGEKMKIDFDLSNAIKHMLFVKFTTNRGVEIKKVISSDAKR
ncbi:T9SS type A sorting domain-containing protein, partial [Gelidibacter sediminis]|uniref:T9SS type A sorting domain-containing protein n=1 Tax=Gelidibacter sediminis TaxID=1608710 RepID=UPI0014153142